MNSYRIVRTARFQNFKTLCARVSIFFMLTIVGVHAVSAGAQQRTLSASQCKHPEMNLLQAPESTTGFVEVEVDFFLLDIVDINDSRSRFTLDFTLDLRWQDSRLV